MGIKEGNTMGRKLPHKLCISVSMNWPVCQPLKIYDFSLCPTYGPYILQCRTPILKYNDKFVLKHDLWSMCTFYRPTTGRAPS